MGYGQAGVPMRELRLPVDAPSRPRLTPVREPAARVVRAVAFVVRDRRIPRPFRWIAALGLLPIPGPFDEAVLLLVAIPLFVFYRQPMREAWQRTAPASRPS